MKITPYEIRGLWIGLLGGILWGINTVIIGVILSRSIFADYLLVAPLISTFLHDAFSSIWMMLHTLLFKRTHQLKQSLKSRDGKVVMIAALLGGPIGMSGFMLSIYFIGPSYTAIISSMYPAIGSFFSFLFLKEKVTHKNIIGLSLSIIATIFLGLISQEEPQNLIFGLTFALLCVIGWGSESVISAYGMKNDVLPSIALQIRQTVSAIVYGVLIVPIIGGISLVKLVLQDFTIVLFALTALIGTASYLFYYTSINRVGPIKAMGLNISYSAWAVLFGLLLGFEAGVKEFLLALVIITGSILTTNNPKEFFTIISFKRGLKI
ncbi:DMT family transporter [Lysinibacillus sp. FJAT-14745]|uniref:DMT family transporter n=1 Tax=Lysinibacillus sp. FJAT-14745 TaxID=1704289 RepID=UPI0006ABC9EF|nr:DMT family transporter [Lysinibacillus sp. FJAT-14745]